MIPLEIGNLAVSHPPDWGLALGISTAGFAASTFTDTFAARSQVREFTHETLAEWDVNRRQGADEILAVAWELAANAIQHALRTTAPHTRTKAWLGLVRKDGAIVCAVTDPSTSLPQHRPSSLLDETGRGLFLVTRLSTAWGWSVSHAGTKTVWARVPTRP
ncbi:ATP-binding protein [Streptomyces sp. NBC_00887]|uniref:ATP-binding protein n=1 Tax=Streptomyces sp. NBC_00887 TaxID=2975859 RepID=UPI003868F64D|nr:ATP-binding protein [Streptomyces sp. NBC_00887]WSY36368.1 ATP-binding protein [Streptomyces sp. NBC_00887]